MKVVETTFTSLPVIVGGMTHKLYNTNKYELYMTKESCDIFSVEDTVNE